MKHVVITLSLILLISFSSPLLAQEKQQKIETKVMVIEASDLDTDKNVWISDDGKRIDIESDNMLFIGSDDTEGDKDISVNVNTSIKDGQEVREIEITIQEDGQTKVIEWEDDGVTIPADIQAMLEKEGIDIQMFSGDEEMTITVDATTEEKSSQEEKSVSVNIESNDENGEIIRDVEITIESDGEKQVMKWRDNGETPAEIQEQLDELGIDLNMAEGGEHLEDVEVVIEKIMGEDNDTDSVEKRVYKIELEGDEDLSDDMRQEMQELGIDIDALIEEAKEHKTGDDPVMMKKRIKIMKEGNDQNGSESIKIIRLKEGEELPADIKEMLEKEGINLDELHEGHSKQSQNGKDNHTIKIKKDGAQVKILQYDVEGEMPVELKRHIAKQYQTQRISNKAQLGAVIEEHDQGILVTDIINNSAASRIGMTSGDVITHVDGLQVFDITSLMSALNDKEPGDQAHFTFLRDDIPYNATATLQSDKVVAETCDTNNMTGDKSVDVLFKTIRITKDERELEILDATDKRVDSATIQVNPQSDVELRELPINDNNKKLKLDNFKAYPNPTSGFVNISFEGEATPLTVQISDITGKTIFKETLNSFSGHFNKNIDLSDAPKGQIVLHVIQGQKVFTENIVVQ